MIEDVAVQFDAAVLRSPVGERNVVQIMTEAKAIVGGEGNGGPMVPAVNPSRDAVVGAAYILSLLAAKKASLADIVGSIPSYVMIKEKVTLKAADFSALVPELKVGFGTVQFDVSDGLRASWPDKWVHVRPSNTEPIVRISAEAADEKTAMSLVDTAREVVS